MHEFNNPDLMKAQHKILLSETEIARIHKKIEISRPKPQNPFLTALGDLLISLGMKLKDAAMQYPTSHGPR